MKSLIDYGNDFSRDVIEILKTRRVTFHGCKPDYLEQTGTNVKIWFYGHRNGKPWAGGVTIISQDAENALAVGDSKVLAELCEQIIDSSHTRFDKINPANH